MDWDRIEDIMSQNAQRLVFIDSISFLLDFLETLFKALEDCASVDQCASLYPRAGPLLTKFATHPYIGCNEKLVSLVINCLVEYTKYSFDSTTISSDAIPRSSIWCLQRLRRLSQCPTTSQVRLVPSTLERKIDTVATKIQEQSEKGTLTTAKMGKLCDMTMLLLEGDTAFKVIGVLLDAALALDERQRNERRKHDIVRWNDTTDTCALSDRFTQHVLSSMDDENGFYQKQWSVSVKTKAWQAIPDLFECEWIDWVGKQLDSDSKQSMGQVGTIIQHPLLEGLKQSPHLIYASFILLSRWVFDSGLMDWRIVGLWIKLLDWHLKQESIDNLQKKIRSWDFPEKLTHLLDMMWHTSSLSTCHANRLYPMLVSFIYEGSPLYNTQRRNQAWLLSLMCPVYNFWCVKLWIGWCAEDQNMWSDTMDQVSKYIAWLICPSLDERMDTYYYGLKSWIHSLKGFDRRDPADCRIVSGFLDDWYILFNGQVQMGVDILVAMIQYSPTWTTDQCIPMIKRFLNRTNTRGASTETGYDDDSVTMTLLERLAALDDARMDAMISYVYSILP